MELLVIDIERQLSGLRFSEDIKIALESSPDRTPEWKGVIESIMTLPGILLEDELRRRNAAINAVIDYCKVEEGGTCLPNQARRPYRSVAFMALKTEEDAQMFEAAETLNRTTSPVYEERRPNCVSYHT